MSEETKTTEETYNFASREVWQEALEKAPPEGWIKQRTLGGAKKSAYVPIPIQQATADRFFNEVDCIDEKYQVIFNEVLCTVKLSVLPSYPNAEHRVMTGTASKPIQAYKGSKVENFPLGKIINSLEYCAPAARSAAISNALSTIGNILGRNLGRTLVNNNYSLKPKKKKSKKSKKSKKDGKE